MPNAAFSIARQGFMFALSSPSGVGKTTVVRHLLKGEQNLALSVSVTTRPPRPSEVEGTHYYFVDENKFRQLLDEDAFLEHAHVYGYLYGTPRAFIDTQLKEGTDVIFDIDWQGVQQLKQSESADVISIFLLPPSLATLEERLQKRAEDGEGIIRKRMDKAGEELSHWAEYDYVIVNNNLEQTVKAVRSILQAERLKRRRQHGLIDFMRALTPIP